MAGTFSSIAVVGSLMRDIIFEADRIPKLGESLPSTALTFKPAGKGANIAVAAHRASRNEPGLSGPTVDDEIQVFMNGAVGDDDIGPTLRSSLGEQGIDVAGIFTLPGEQTGQAVISLDVNARQASQLGFKGANLLFKPRTESIECLTGESHVRPDVVIAHCTMNLRTVERILEMGHRSAVETILSASPPVQLPEAVYSTITHIVLNEHEAAEIMRRNVADFVDPEAAKHAAADFVRLGVKFAIITLGERGAVYATHEGKIGYVLAEKDVKVRDSTGAGDSFLGAYAVSSVRQRKGKANFDIEKAVSFASKAAARTIESVGAQTSLPWANQIEHDPV